MLENVDSDIPVLSFIMADIKAVAEDLTED